MGRFIAGTFTLLAMSCGSPLEPSGFVPKHVPQVVRDMPELPDDADVKLITGEFYSNAQMLGAKAARDVESISFVDTYGKCSNTVGQCEYYSYEDGSIAYKKLTLKKDFWDQATVQTKRTLLYHELGHCALNLDHTAEDSLHIMRPTVLFDSEADLVWFDLVRDLFTTDPLLTTLALEGDETEEECVE